MASSKEPSETVHRVEVTKYQTPLLGPHQRYTHYYSVAPHTAVAHQYPSIRYAQPLTSADRFRRAKALPGISLPLDFRQTPVCPQPGLKGRSAELVDEDCLLADVYVPADVADQESERRPVLFFIHGGFLQWGSVHGTNAAELCRRTGAVVVIPAYRLNAFGFLSSETLRDDKYGGGDGRGVAGNVGFWDQRLALEWVARNIHAFGGDGDRITIAGYSAGSYSVFHQLMYESYLPDGQALIRAAMMHSNGCGLQPKSLDETRVHFDGLARAAGISPVLTPAQRITALRRLSAAAIVRAVERTPENAYRAVTDGLWVRKTYMQDIASGQLGEVLRRRGVRLIMGECKEERKYYAQISPPDSYLELVARLAVEFPAVSASRLAALYAPRGKLPAHCKDWEEVFGYAYSDAQVHLTERGLLKGLMGAVRPENVHRYRIYKRLKAADRFLPPELGVSHSSDMVIWFAGSGMPVEGEEKQALDAWLLPLRDFLAGKETDWGCSGFEDMRTFGKDGWEVATEKDPLWKDYMWTWKRLFASRTAKI